MNADLEFQRNRERYALLRWAQKTFTGFKVVPPDTGIVHQVNLEYLARVVITMRTLQALSAIRSWGPTPHTTMINGLGVLGWGVGGIEAEAAMLGQPVSMLIPQVVGFQLSGSLQRRHHRHRPRAHRHADAARRKASSENSSSSSARASSTLPLADRATIGNMAPEYGATIGIFPVDQETLRYLEFTGRSPEQVKLVEAYMKEQGLFHTARCSGAASTRTRSS